MLIFLPEVSQAIYDLSKDLISRWFPLFVPVFPLKEARIVPTSALAVAVCKQASSQNRRIFDCKMNREGKRQLGESLQQTYPIVTTQLADNRALERRALCVQGAK